MRCAGDMCGGYGSGELTGCAAGTTRSGSGCWRGTAVSSRAVPQSPSPGRDGLDGCGALRAASGSALPEGAFGAVVTTVRKNISGAASFEDAIVQHTRQVATDLITRSPVLRQACAAGALSVVAAHYTLADGRVMTLA